MSTITLPNIRVSSDLTVKVRLKDSDVAIDWSTLTKIKASIYSDAQRALAGRCDVSIDAEDPTLLVCNYAANKPQYVGVNRIVVSAKYMGETKTYDKPAFNFVRWTADQEGEQITIDDPDVDVEISVEDISSSILQEAVDAAFEAADRANDAAAAAEHMVDIHTGPEGKSAYEVAVEEGYTGTEEEWLASLKGDTGETPDITIGTVTTAEPGTPAAATMTGTPEDPVLNLTIPQGAVGATPTFTVGTVTTGAPGSSVIVTITGTAEAPVLNITIPQGMQGNTGSSVDYPYELVNNLTTNDSTKGLSAAQGVVLDGKVSQLEAKVDEDSYLLALEDIINAGYTSFEQGTISGGANSASTTRLRFSDAVPIAKVHGIAVPVGFRVQAVYYYNSWTDSSTYSYNTWEAVGERVFTFNSSYNYARPIFRNEANDTIVVSDIMSALITLNEVFERIDDQLDKKINGFTLLRGYLDETTSGLIWKDIGTGSRYYYVIPCTAKEKVVVTPGTGNGFIVALSAYEPVSNTQASYTYKKALSAGGSATTFVTPVNTTYIYIFASSFGENRLPSQLSIGGIEYFADLVERVDILSENVDYLMGEEFPYNYDGNKISFGNKFNRRTMFSLSDSYPKAQGSACYGDFLFVFHDQNATVQVYNMATLTFVQSIAMSSSEQGTDVHCNSVNFGTEFYDPSDPFPLLYCSTEAQKNIFVYRVILSEGVYSLVRVQTITFANFPTGQNGFNYPNGIPDNWNERLYIMGLKTYPWSSSADNTIILGFYPMPKLSDGNVTLDYSNLQDVFTIPNSPTTQGATFVDGKLYAALGTDQSCMLYVINPSSHSVETKVDLKASGMNDAPENVFYYAGDLYTNWYTKRVIKLIF